MKNQKNVIRFPKQPGPCQWTFWDYCEGDRNLVEEWYKGLSDEARFTFDDLLKQTRKTENHLEWGVRNIKGEGKKQKLWEFRFIADKVQHRMIFLFDASRRAVLLLGCYHKGNVYIPSNWLTTACKRAKVYRSGMASISERKIRTDQ